MDELRLIRSGGEFERSKKWAGGNTEMNEKWVIREKYEVGQVPCFVPYPV